MKEQIDRAIQYFENEIEQYETRLNGIVSKEYEKHIVNMLSNYRIALYALNELLE